MEKIVFKEKQILSLIDEHLDFMKDLKREFITNDYGYRFMAAATILTIFDFMNEECGVLSSEFLKEYNLIIKKD